MLRLRSLLVPVVLATACAAPVVAQSIDLPALSPQCPGGAAPKLDSATVTVGLWPSKKWRDASYDAAQRLRLQYYADAIRRHFVAPSSLGELPVLGEGEPKAKSDDGHRSTVEGSLVLIVTPDGRVAKLAWQQRPMSVPLGAAIVAATMTADSAGAFDGIPRREGAIDTLSLSIGSWSTKQPEGAAALLRARIAGYRVDRDVSVRTRVAPEYPENARRNFAEDATTVVFIVGSGGAAYVPSFQVTCSRFADFEAPVRAAIGESAYKPSESNGCAVPRLVSQRFDFRLPRPDE